jgi:hypothetical protein
MRFFLLTLLALPLLGAPVNHNAPVNRNYGRVTESNTVEYAPISLQLGNIVNGRAFPHPVTVLNPSAAQYSVQGWLPVMTNAPMRAGFVAEASGFWCVSNNAVVPIFTWRALPPRNLQLSKMRLKANLRNFGAWDDIWAYISADADVLQDWNDSVVLDEQNPVVQGAFNALRQMLPDDAIEAVITNSVTEIEVRQ